MKGLLIFLALLGAGAYYFFTSIPQISSYYLASVQKDEGTPDSIKAATQGDEKTFVDTYKPFLHKRWLLAHVAFLLDDNVLQSVGKDTVAVYGDTPLEKDPEYGFLLFHYAEITDNKGGFAAAFPLYRKYVALFPDGSDAGVARSAAVKIEINHGVSE